MGKRKTNWDRLQNRPIDQTTANRDVYESQQLERGRLGKRQGMLTRTIFSVFFGIFIGVLMYCALSVVGGLLGSFLSFGDSGTEGVQQEAEVSEVNEAVLAGMKPLSEAPTDVTLDELKAEYLLYVASDASTADMTGYYLDTEGNTYSESELPGLLSSIAAGEFLSETAQYDRYLDGLRAGNEYGVLPLSIAPMNIEYNDFVRLYFMDLSSGSLIHRYADFEGNEYSSEEVQELYSMVQAGTLGSGQVSYQTADGGSPTGTVSTGEAKRRSWFAPTLQKMLLSFVTGLLSGLVMLLYMRRNLDAQNLLNDTTDINQYENDQHIQLPEELQRNYDWFPDVGAHSRVQVSSMLSHMALSNKGLNKIRVTRRAKEDILDEDGNILYLKGEPLVDDNDVVITDLLPAIDEAFMDELFTVSGIPKEEKKLRKRYDAMKIPYNPGNMNREKLKGYNTVADLINGDWKLPAYETQRPAGAYIVDTEPVNTMVLAITRAGKGQTYIEAVLDMWTREINYNNMVINDPKGELLVKFYVRGAVRGFQIIQFNLINVMNTDIYNALGLASESAREGDFTKCAQYVENIAEVFFPVDGSEDPVWPNAANNAFKRAAYGLIDYYLEKEKKLRREAEKTNMPQKVLDSKIDALWGKVTLYNCYQLFVQMTSKKLRNPVVEFTKKAKAGAFQPGGPEEMTDEEYNKKLAELEKQSKLLWEDKTDADMLTLFFNASNQLPRNQMRTLVRNADDALRSMGGAEKMMASVYGIAITAMSFFADPTISTLTSGTPSQNVDLGGLSFPRRFGVRFHSNFLTRYHLIGMQSRWMSYEDDSFTKPLGKDFAHEEIISREGWMRYYFKGIYEQDTAYIKAEIVNPSTGVKIREFFFKFVKGYQMSLDARYYVKDPVLDEKIVKNGVLTELLPVERNGKIVYEESHTVFVQNKIRDVFVDGAKPEKVKTRAITQYMVRYSEKPKMVFLITPPHLMKYAKLILILIKQLVDLNFDRSYMTKSNQKPLYKTRFMLDELGNLQSEGHGISGFQTMLSIGLGQEQQFTIILQTLQQLRDVYGESVDKIVQGNTSNIIFLKSTDDSMIETLQKMSGTTHRVYSDTKTVTRDLESIIMKNEGKASYQMTAKEEPVIKYNDMAFIAPRNSIVFRAGDPPIWNRNETILPMSWKVQTTTITQPGKDYSLATVPTTSSAIDFDVRKNQPNFAQMWEDRRKQALVAGEVEERYQKAYGYDDYQMEQLDQEVLADELMELIDRKLVMDEGGDPDAQEFAEEPEFSMQDLVDAGYADENEEQAFWNADAEKRFGSRDKRLYAKGLISPSDLVGNSGFISGSLDKAILNVYERLRGSFAKDTKYFSVRPDGSLYNADGSVLYIRRQQESTDFKRVNNAIQDVGSAVYGEETVDEQDVTSLQRYRIEKAFYHFLTDFDGEWPFTNGAFAEEMAREMEGDA